jgi:outer membrane usher protein
MPTNLPILILYVFSALAFPGLATAAAAEDESVSNFEVTLVVDGRKQAETWINLSEGGTLIEIPASPVLSALSGMADAETLTRLERQMTSSGTLTNKILARFGISLGINVPRRQVLLGMAKPARKNNPAPVAGSPPAPPKPGQQPPLRPAKAQDDSGPWATPPVPALAGSRNDSASTGASGKTGNLPQGAGKAEGGPAASDREWEPVSADSPRGNAAVPNAAPGPPPQTSASPQLQTYQLDRTRDELFEDVFNHKPPPLPKSVEVTLLVDGKSYGTLWIFYSEPQKCYTFPVDPVLNALQGLVKRELWEKLAHRASSQSRFTVQDLIDCGFPTVLNTSVFELSTGIPAQLMGTQAQSLSGRVQDPYSVPIYEQSAFSAYMNFRVKDRLPYYQYNPTPYDSAGFGKQQVESNNKNPRQPAIVELDGAVNLKAWVLEGRGIVWERPELNAFEFTRQDIRLVHDWPKRSLRLTLGDLIFPTSGFQTFQNIGGIGFSRDFSLQPHLVAYPVKEYEFFLPNPSEVKVYINGTLKGTYQMEQGTHDMQGFPFTAGESEVEIRITDNTGQMQTLKFNFIHETSLLAKGITAFSYDLGFPRRETYRVAALPEEPGGFRVLNYEYDLGHPFLFLDYRRGLSDRTTAEGYTQAIDTAGMVGVNVLHALPLGKVKGEAAASYAERDGPGWAANVEYTYIPKANATVSPTSWRLRAEYIGSGFFRPNQDRTLLGSLTVAEYFQKHLSEFDVNFGTSYTMRPDSIDFYSVSMGLSKNWGKGWTSSLSLRNTFDRQRIANTSVSANVFYYFNQGNNALYGSERVENHVPDGLEKGTPPDWDFFTDLFWDYNGSAPFPNNPALNMATSFGPLTNDYSGKAAWTSDQGSIELSGHRYEPKTTSVIFNYLDVTLRSSLVYVDGNFALARPISNSFVLVKGIQNEKNCNIAVDSNGLGYDAMSRKWLPGVVPYVNPYYLKKIHLDVIDPPFGSNEERTDYTIYPGYKSGYAFYMGSSATIIALGTLQLAPGVPAQYQTFTATPLDGKPQDPIAAFTNGAGKFQLTRLQPGRYRIEMDVDGKSYTVTLVLPKDAAGIKSVGLLTLAPK